MLEKSSTPQSKKKRGTYVIYSPSDRARIGKYAAENGPASTLRKFKTDFPDIKESTVRYFRDSYKREVSNKKRRLDFDDIDDCQVNEIQVKKRGRKTLLQDEMDKEVQLYITNLRKSGGVVNTSIVRAVGLGIVMAHDKQLLSENDGPITLSKTWAYSLLQRMNFVKRRGSCTAKVNIRDEKFEDLKSEFFSKIKNVVNEHNIPADLIYNWDHTGLHYVPVSNWTMEVEGTSKIPIVGLDDKRQITAVFAGIVFTINC